MKTPNPYMSYKTLRKIIGILGISLPFLCILFGFLEPGFLIQPSISDYYCTNVRDIFVGTLFLTGFFLMCYKDYERIDQNVNFITGLFGIFIAIFPCCDSGIFILNVEISNIIHTISAVLFFLLLALNSIFLFTKTDGNITEMKIVRNKVYIISGIIILTSIFILILSHLFLDQDTLSKYKITLILETVMLLSFGTSWLVKGEVILKD